MAVAALVLGILALLLCWLPFVGQLLAIAGLIVGIIALLKAPAGKKGMPVAGTALSGAGLVLGVLIVAAIMIPAISSVRDEAMAQQSAHNMRQIATAVIMAQTDHGEWVIDQNKLTSLYPHDASTKIFVDKRGGPQPHYLIVPSMSQSLPMVVQNPAMPGRQHVVVFGDGHFEKIDQAQADWLWQRAQQLRQQPDITKKMPSRDDWGDGLPDFGY